MGVCLVPDFAHDFYRTRRDLRKNGKGCNHLFSSLSQSIPHSSPIVEECLLSWPDPVLGEEVFNCEEDVFEGADGAIGWAVALTAEDRG